MGPPPGDACRRRHPGDAALVRELLDEAVESLAADGSDDRACSSQARAVFEQVALADDFPPFLTLPAYELLALNSATGPECSDLDLNLRLSLKGPSLP